MRCGESESIIELWYLFERYELGSVAGQHA